MDLTSNQQSYEYSFPLLKNPEIIACLSEAGIEMTQNELVEPQRHKERIKAVFAGLVQLGLGLSEDHFSSTSMQLMKKRQKLPHPELHEDSFGDLKFLKACMKLMRICGVRDFGFADLHAPIGKRFKRQLSGAINFIKFREERLALYAEIHEQREELLVGLKETNDEKAMLIHQLEQVKLQADERWNEAKVVDDDCIELEREIASQNKLQASIRKESLELRKKANIFKDKIATAELAMQELEAEERKLLPKVVQSPQALKKDMAQLTDFLNEEKSNCEDAKRDAKTTELRVRNVTKAQSDVVATTSLAKEVMAEEKKFEKATREVIEIEAKIESLQIETNKLTEIIEDDERELRRTEEKSNHNRKQSKIKMEAAQASLNAANTELLLVEKDRRDATSRVDQSEQELRVLKAIIEEEQLKTSNEISEILSAFKNMEQTILEQQEKFDATISAH